MRPASVCRFFCFVSAVMSALASFALTLPPMEYADTETSTNIPFSAAPPEWLNIRQCNRLLLTGCGLDGHGKSFETVTTIDAIAIRY